MNALVVNVGGGIGIASLALAEEFSNLRIVVQDRPPVVENGIEVRLPFIKLHSSLLTDLIIIIGLEGKMARYTIMVVFSSKVREL